MRPSDRGIKRWTHRRSGLPGARQLLLRAREKGQQASEADTLHLGAAIAARIDPFEAGAVQEQYHAAMALAEELRMRPLIAHCHLGLGKLYRRMGKLEQAQQHLTPATTMYGEMGMTYWLEKAETEPRVGSSSALFSG